MLSHSSWRIPHANISLNFSGTKWRQNVISLSKHYNFLCNIPYGLRLTIKCIWEFKKWVAEAPRREIKINAFNSIDKWHVNCQNFSSGGLKDMECNAGRDEVAAQETLNMLWRVLKPSVGCSNVTKWEL